MDIKSISTTIREGVAAEAADFRAQGIEPRVSVILVGGDEASLQYAQTKKKVAEGLGITVDIETFSETISQSELEVRISAISHDEKVHGMLLESPFPAGLDYAKALAQVDPLKDIDGLHVDNLGKLQSGDLESAIIAATPLACLHLMEAWGGSVAGKRIVLVGSGRTVGKPLAMLLMHHGATVIACNQHTRDVPSLCQSADIIVSAVGKPGLITTAMVNDQSFVIDVGTAINEAGKMAGDVDYETVSKIAKYVTPVPGGVGMVTTGMVFQNLMKAMRLQTRRNHFDLSMNDFIRLASGPTMPGGGGISAVVGILGATMASMVFSLTKDPSIADAHARIPGLIHSLQNTYQSDIDAFNGYLAGLKLPKETDEQKAVRSASLQASLVASCEVPLQFGETCRELLEICVQCAESGNKNVISDVSVAAILIEAAVKSAFEAIELNLGSIRDATLGVQIAERKERTFADMQRLSAAVRATIADR